MKHPHKKQRHATDSREAHAERIRRRDRRMLLRVAVALAVLVPVGAIGIGWYQRHAAELRDLTVIGNGSPTVVQVYDYGSRTSRQLRERLTAVERELTPRVQFRLADQATADGALLASRFGAAPETLLLFGPDGSLRDRVAGTQDAQAIRAAIEQAL